MSLDNIQLQPNMLASLFNNSLIDLKEKQQATEIAKQSSLAYLGKNEKQIAVIVNKQGFAYLPENELTLLLEIMQACKNTMQDIAIVNIDGKTITHEFIDEAVGYEKMLLFGVATAQLNLPMQIPNYQVQSYGGKTYIASPDLSMLDANRDEKKLLWAGLKKMFGL